MIIAVDFDGTIVEHAYPKIGAPVAFAIETLKHLQQDGHTLLLWSVRTDELLQEAVDYCAKKGVKFYAANKNSPEENPARAPRKLNADIFIDDRNVGGLPDWGLIYSVVEAMSNGEDDFHRIMMSVRQNQRSKSRRKKNFLIRLGEMFQKGY